MKKLGVSLMLAGLIWGSLWSTVSVADGPYYRFWQGNKRDFWYNDSAKVFTPDDFIRKLNEWLIPATTSCCAKESLLAYLPVVPPYRKVEGLHDEYALIVYHDEAIYKKVRDTDPEGMVYGPLHGYVFDTQDPKSSRSAVPIPFAGNIDIFLNDATVTPKERAYDILGSDIDWQKGFTAFRVALRKEKDDAAYEIALANYFSMIKETAQLLHLQGYVVLIDDKKMVEYTNWASQEDFKNFSRSKFEMAPPVSLILSIYAKPQEKVAPDPLSYPFINFGQGGTIQFTPGEKPGQVHHPLLKN